MSVLNKYVSYYQNHAATHNGQSVNLLTLLNSRKHELTIKRLRNCTDLEMQREIKNKLPCYTVSGIFRTRTKADWLEASGLACIDLDEAEKYDVQHLSKELRKLPYIAYSGLSCRGQRLFLIVQFSTPEYERHYERLTQSFEEMGLPMGDSCHKNPAQPRYVSYNDESTHWFNHNAKPYNLLPERKTYHPSIITYHNTPNNPFRWCVEQVMKTNTFLKGKRHHFIVALARYCNLKGLEQNDTLMGCLEFSEEDFPVGEIKSIVNHIYITQKGSHNTYPFSRV